eukprot:578399-Amorphochlora_amoeboformis.AAC.1
MGLSTQHRIAYIPSIQYSTYPTSNTIEVGLSLGMLLVALWVSQRVRLSLLCAYPQTRAQVV